MDRSFLALAPPLISASWILSGSHHGLWAGFRSIFMVLRMWSYLAMCGLIWPFRRGHRHLLVNGYPFFFINLQHYPQLVPCMQYQLRRVKELRMLRLDWLNSAVLRISGRLAGECREEVESFVGSHAALPNIIVDLSEVTYIDRTGEEVLCWLAERGARFTGENAYTTHICERLHLGLARVRNQSRRPKITQGGADHE